MNESLWMLVSSVLFAVCCWLSAAYFIEINLRKKIEKNHERVRYLCTRANFRAANLEAALWFYASAMNWGASKGKHSDANRAKWTVARRALDSNPPWDGDNE